MLDQGPCRPSILFPKAFSSRCLGSSIRTRKPFNDIYWKYFSHILDGKQRWNFDRRGEKTKRKQKSPTHTPFAKAWNIPLKIKKTTKGKINLTDFLFFFFFEKKPAGARKKQNLTCYSQKQWKHIPMHIAGQIISKNLWLWGSMAFLLRKGPRGNLEVGIHVVISQLRAPKVFKWMDL